MEQEKQDAVQALVDSLLFVANKMEAVLGLKPTQVSEEGLTVDQVVTILENLVSEVEEVVRPQNSKIQDSGFKKESMFSFGVNKRPSNLDVV